MNRNDARIIAQTITNEQIQQMLETAKSKITDWTQVSKCNKGCTKGMAWNILAKDFNVSTNYHILTKINMVREFGEFLPDDLKPPKKTRNNQPPIHQNPQF